MFGNKKDAGGGDLQRRLEDLDAEIAEAARVHDFAQAKRLQRERRRLSRRYERSGAAPARARLVERDGSTRRVVPFDALGEDGVMRVDDGHYAVCLEVDDVNYLAARADEQADVRAVWGEYLNSLDHTVSVQVAVQSHRVGDEEFMEMFAMRPVAGDDAGNGLRAEFNDYCRDKLAGSACSMSRTRLAVITVEAPTRAKAHGALVREAERLVRTMRDLDSDARLLDGQAWLDRVCSVTHPGDEQGVVSMRELHGSADLTARDLAAPTSLTRVDGTRGDSRLIINGRRWAKSYVMLLEGYGRSMRDNFISDLTALPYDITVSWHIRPWETDAAISNAERHLNAVTEENDAYMKSRSDPSRGYFVDRDTLPSSMRDALSEAQALRDDLVRYNMRNFSVTTVILVTGRDEDELAAACSEVEAVFSAHRKALPDSWSAMREQGLTTALPLGVNLLPYQRTLTTEPLSNMLMWASAELLDRGGMLMGVNPYTRGFELYDPTAQEHTNSFTIGMPGHGKSMNAKFTRIIQTRLRHPDDDIIVIDPENEYSACTEMLGGQVIAISETSPSHINPMDISVYYGSDDPGAVTNPVPSKVSFIQALVHMMASQVNDVQTNLLDQAARFAYSAWLDDPREGNVPTLQDVYDFLMAVEGSNADDARQLAQMIERFVCGTLSVFNHRTDVNITSRLVNFMLADLSAELKPIAMLIMLDHIWVRVTANRRTGRRTWLIIDEFQLLLDDPYAVDKFDRFFTRGRKWDLYNLGITQTISRLLDIPQTRYMLQNCPMLTIMGQSADGARELAELLGLSEAQERFIRTASPGQGLYYFKNMVVPFDFTVSERVCPRLYALATTKPEDVKRMRAAGAQAAPPAPAAPSDWERTVAALEASRDIDEPGGCTRDPAAPPRAHVGPHEEGADDPAPAAADPRAHFDGPAAQDGEAAPVSDGAAAPAPGERPAPWRSALRGEPGPEGPARATRRIHVDALDLEEPDAAPDDPDAAGMTPPRLETAPHDGKSSPAHDRNPAPAHEDTPAPAQGGTPATGARPAPWRSALRGDQGPARTPRRAHVGAPGHDGAAGSTAVLRRAAGPSVDPAPAGAAPRVAYTAHGGSARPAFADERAPGPAQEGARGHRGLAADDAIRRLLADPEAAAFLQELAYAREGAGVEDAMGPLEGMMAPDDRGPEPDDGFSARPPHAEEGRV